MDRVKCANEGCDKLFVKKTHNQLYHSSECTKEATNRRIMENYYKKKARRAGKKRICSENGCETVLSRYNDEDTCAPCKRQKRLRVGRFA